MNARRVAAGIVVGVLVGACANAEPRPQRDTDTTGASAQPAAREPARFGFGTPAESALIARWNIDVRPDGVGLPAGRGSADQGRTVYLAHCAVCHGVTGREGPAPVLVGGDPWGTTGPPRVQTIGNYWPYATTLYDYIVRAMPQNAPGSLDADDTYAVIAWLLASNGIVARDALMDAATLPKVRMPARDRFVPDDRHGSTIR